MGTAYRYDNTGQAHAVGEYINGSRPMEGSFDTYEDYQASRVKDQQVNNAQSFRNNMPAMKNKMAEGLASQNNIKMNADLRTTNENSNSRGMLYGGHNAGQRAGVRANAQANLASGIGTINNGLEDAANTFDQQAIGTGMAIQKSQQDIQNQVYSQALAQQNAQNSMVGSAASTGLLLAMI